MKFFAMKSNVLRVIDKFIEVNISILPHRTLHNIDLLRFSRK